MDTYQLYIGGKFVDAEGGVTKPTHNPYNGEPIANIPVASVADAEAAIAAARDAFDNGPWPRMSGEERSEIICTLAAKMKERMKDLARLESLDSGGTIAKTGADAFSRSAPDELFRHHGEEVQFRAQGNRRHVPSRAVV